MDELERTLAAVASGTLSPEKAAGRLKRGEVRYLGEFATLDLGRSTRKGVPEVVYAPPPPSTKRSFARRSPKPHSGTPDAP